MLPKKCSIAKPIRTGNLLSACNAISAYKNGLKSHQGFEAVLPLHGLSLDRGSTPYVIDYIDRISASLLIRCFVLALAVVQLITLVQSLLRLMLSNPPWSLVCWLHDSFLGISNPSVYLDCCAVPASSVFARCRPLLNQL